MRIDSLSNEEYHHSERFRDYISSTQLKLYDRSPLHFRHNFDNPTEEKSPAMEFGSLFHEMMEHFARHGTDTAAIQSWRDKFLIPEPLVNPRTGKPYGADTQRQQDYINTLIERNPGKRVIADDTFSRLTDMAVALLDRGDSPTAPLVEKLLRWGSPEVSFFYETEEGVKLKIRPDLLTRDKIVDWKTTSLKKFDKRSIQSVIEDSRYLYSVSIAMYQYVMHALTGKWYEFYNLFIQTEPPYESMLVNTTAYGYQWVESMQDAYKGAGAKHFERLLSLHTDCLSRDSWPGADSYETEDGVLTLSPSEWYERKFEEEI